eukprot:5466039-Prorocentrum_lima.AAC.1
MGTPCAARSLATVAASQAGEEVTQLFAEMRTPSFRKEAARVSAEVLACSCASAPLPTVICARSST